MVEMIIGGLGITFCISTTVLYFYIMIPLVCVTVHDIVKGGII